MSLPEENLQLASCTSSPRCSTLTRARSDLVALSELLEAYRPYLLKVAARHIDPQIKAKLGESDAVQETLLRAHFRFGNYRSETLDGIKPWLRRLLINQLADLRRRFCSTEKRGLYREVSLNDVDSDDYIDAIASPIDHSPASKLILHDEWAVVEASLARLPPHYAAVIRWRICDGMSFPQIGQMLERTPGAVRMLWVRAMGELQQIVRSCGVRLDDH